MYLLLDILLTLLLIYSQDIFKGSIAEIKINTKMSVKTYLFDFNKQFIFSLDETRMRQNEIAPSFLYSQLTPTPSIAYILNK